MLISEGIDFKTVSDLLGHSTVGMTLDTYAGVYEDKKTAAVNLLANIMKKSNLKISLDVVFRFSEKAYRAKTKRIYQSKKVL